MEDFTQLSCRSFVELLSTKAAVPGGGGASALAGALGTALGCMVGSLTVGKKKYAAVEEEVQALMAEAQALQTRLLGLVAEDAAAFEPLSRAYGLPAASEEEKAHKQQVMEAALDVAAGAPLRIMEACCEAVRLHEAFAEKGSVIAISDVGVGVALCRAALQGASLNVLINTKSMQNRPRADELNRQVQAMLDEYIPRADAAYRAVEQRFEQ